MFADIKMSTLCLIGYSRLLRIDTAKRKQISLSFGLSSIVHYNNTILYMYCTADA